MACYTDIQMMACIIQYRCHIFEIQDQYVLFSITMEHWPITAYGVFRRLLWQIVTLYALREDLSRGESQNNIIHNSNKRN